MEYKLIFFDVDGTLFNSNKELSDVTLQAIHFAHEQGKEIVICSGRCIDECYQFFESTPEIRYYILTNGSLVYDYLENKTIYLHAMDIQTIHSIFDEGKNRDIMFHILDYKGILEKEKIEVCDQYGMGQYKPMYHKMAYPVDDIVEYYNQNETPLQKINIYHRNLEQRKITRKHLQHLNIDLANAESTNLECTAKGVNKGEGLLKLCEYLHISPEQTIAVGDSGNDIPMLQQAGLAIAMANAAKEVKDICDVIVSDNDHDGCKEVIENYLCI